MNSKRIFAFLIDYLITALIMNFPFWFLIMIPLITRNAPPVNSIIVRALISTLIAFLYLILRDIPSKCSIGKRILKLTVIDSSTKKNAQVYHNVRTTLRAEIRFVLTFIFVQSI